MITVYLDESEHSNASKYMAVAGFFGNEQQWTSFAPEWRQALGRRKYLHMSALRIKSKPERAKRLLDSLGPLPYKHGLQPICSAVKVGDYLDLIEDGDLAMKALAGYTTCLSTILHALNLVVPGHESIEIVCEMQKQYDEEAYRTFRAMRIRMADPAKPYFSGIKFIPKESSILIQPADCFAYAVTHWYEDPKSHISTICRPILGNGIAHGYKLSRTKAREIIARTKSIVKRAGAKW